ncbi:hypothetical protein D3C87_1611730 [compost metagenome]
MIGLVLACDGLNLASRVLIDSTVPSVKIRASRLGAMEMVSGSAMKVMLAASHSLFMLLSTWSHISP